MKPFAAVLIVTLLTGCKQQSFDERYKSAQQKLEAKTAAIDKDLAVAQSDAAAAGVIATDTVLPEPELSEPAAAH